MSQPISTEALSYARTLPVDEHQRAWRSVARIIGVACVCYGLYWLAYMAGRVLFEWPGLGSTATGSPSGWVVIYQLVATWAYAILSVALVAGGIGMMLYQPSLRRLLVWAAGFLIVVSIAGSVVAAYTVFEQWSSAAWVRRAGTPALSDFYRIGTAILSALVKPIIICGLTIALLTRRPLVQALEATQPRILPAGLQILLALALVVGLTGLIARPLTLFMDIAAPVLQDKGMAYGVGFTYERGGPSLASAWYVSTRAVLWICGGLMVIGALAGLGLRLWGLQLLIAQARVAIVINVVDLFLGAVMLHRAAAIGSAYVTAGFVVQGSMILLDSIIIIYLANPTVRACFTGRHVLAVTPAISPSVAESAEA